MFSLSKLYDKLLMSTREIIMWQEGTLFKKNIRINIFNDLVMVTQYFEG